MADTDQVLRPAVEQAVAMETADPESPETMGDLASGVVVSYVVLAEVRGYDSYGEAMSRVFVMVPDDASVIQQVGLVAYASHLFASEIGQM